MWSSDKEVRRYCVVIVASFLCLIYVAFGVPLSGCGGKDNGGGGEAQCGDGVVEGSEQCDGEDLNGQSCEDVGNYIGGTLGCDTDCTFDTSLCTVSLDCGNGVIDDGEECDGNELGGMTCGDLEGFQVGDLSCSNDCTFDTSQCIGELCGNGVIDDDEECDGTALGGMTCSDLGDFSGGTLTCGDNCVFDTSACISESQECPREDLGSDTSILYNGDTTGLPNLVTSSRLEWQDAPDDSLLFTAPEAGDYEIVITDEPSVNGGCGASVWDYTTDEFYDESWCPDSGSTTEIDGFYTTSGYPHYFEEGETVLIWFSCTYWADVQSGPYTLTIEKQ